MTLWRSFFKAGHSLVLMSGWRAHFLCVVLGCVSAAGLAPLYFFPLLWCTFPFFVLLLDGAAPNLDARGIRRFMPSFWRGYLFGFGYFVAGLWWLGGAFLVNAEEFAWLMPFAVIGLPLVLAIFFGLATMIARLFHRAGAFRLLAFAASFALLEGLRATILTGFPWNSLGALLAANEVMMQALSITGSASYVFLSVLIFSAPVLLFDAHENVPMARRLFWSIAVLFSGLLAFGLLRLATAETQVQAGINLRIIQPNIPQDDKFKPENARSILERYLEMSSRSTEPGNLGLLATTHLVWPESAFPFILTEQPEALAAIANLLPPGTSLLTGAVRSDPRIAGQERVYYNSLYAIGDEGQILNAYDKVHLVPFGEYLPFERMLEDWGLLPLIELPGGFTAGTKKPVMKIGSAPPFLPLICYEIIFPQDLVSIEQGGVSATWILNVTNDAWFGLTSGPYQHFHQSRLRAIEEGLPVIRVANNGVSAVIDAYGRAVKSLPLGEAGIIDAELPPKVVLPVADIEKTYIFWILVGGAFLVSILAGRVRQ